MTGKWRDIRMHPITKTDGDAKGDIVQKLRTGGIVTDQWNDLRDLIAWMPTSEMPEFIRIPDPPEGWRFKLDGDAFDKRARVLVGGKYWETTNNNRNYSADGVYIVPIDPPAEPEYRPFANAKEFLPYATLFWRQKIDDPSIRRNTGYFSDKGHDAMLWDESLELKVFVADPKLFPDGVPFGIRK